MRLLQSQNQYPDCLSLELTAIPLLLTEEFDLYLTIHFNEQWEQLLDGRLKFGIKKGTLKLTLENSEIEAISETLGDSLGVSRETTTTWVFHSQPPAPVLKGSLPQAKLGKVKVKEQLYKIAASFVIEAADISVTDTEELWRHDLSPNKHGVLERYLAIFLLETKLKPYLSRVVLGSEGLKSEASLPDKEIAASTAAKVQAMIQSIYTAKTEDFLELVKLANLNIMTDFAGGNLLAAELSGVDLSGANLDQVNFRGANLTDADLSEANLSYAKFSGADLSGAYLENANLSNSDLHRASLALANLIGADLTGANLQEANLSNTSLSQARVRGARFGNNTGMSEEMKLTLEERGAIFAPC
ncbi:MAG: pentapeptide repeat-containing protein [Gomphosphaeria aponina SAG 52.96 = DSM 107014]|uniref:Pentapeptide repeat-containing protein n=1 Tax=Gomphosphaeria aponina SAG 52.96 = DSM 107014 TaxID=1521640 RepID=A0A941GW04_9CHRO|nr:pentapeptide repeat-containing protein [Gomphosphaeria aponina SAG 52.96 = DSM 107014]